MLIGLCGGELVVHQIITKAELICTSGICAGKNSVADYLTGYLGFVRLHLAQQTSPALEREQSDVEGSSFANVQSLLDFVTLQWQQRWVTTDVWNENILENLLRRPSFILISVDAPLSLRWRRLKNRWVWQRSMVTNPTRLMIQMSAKKYSLANPGGVHLS